jgi:hypothetical protein
MLAGPTPPRSTRMAWACLLARVFLADALQCARCGARMQWVAARTGPDSGRGSDLAPWRIWKRGGTAIGATPPLCANGSTQAQELSRSNSTAGCGCPPGGLLSVTVPVWYCACAAPLGQAVARQTGPQPRVYGEAPSHVGQAEVQTRGGAKSVPQRTEEGRILPSC